MELLKTSYGTYYVREYKEGVYIAMHKLFDSPRFLYLDGKATMVELKESEESYINLCFDICEIELKIEVVKEKIADFYAVEDEMNEYWSYNTDGRVLNKLYGEIADLNDIKEEQLKLKDKLVDNLFSDLEDKSIYIFDYLHYLDPKHDFSWFNFRNTYENVEESKAELCYMESMRVKLEEYFEVEIILERYERKRDKVLLEVDWELKGKEGTITVEDSLYILKLFKGLQSLENIY